MNLGATEGKHFLLHMWHRRVTLVIMFRVISQTNIILYLSWCSHFYKGVVSQGLILPRCILIPVQTMTIIFDAICPSFSVLNCLHFIFDVLLRF